MKSIKFLLTSMLLSLILITSSCTTKSPQSDTSYKNEIASKNLIQKEAPKNENIPHQPLPSEVTDSSFIPDNLLELSIEDLLKTFISIGKRHGGTDANAKAGKLIKEYFEKSGLEPYKDGTYYDKFFSRIFVPIDGDSSQLATITNGFFENVVGKIKGKDSTKAIVISAHFDTVITTNGVLDNASGTVTLMKLAKALSDELKGKEFPVDLIFAAFNAEEDGLIGSKYFLSTLSKEYKNLYNLNMDSIGLKDSPLAYKNPHPKSQNLYDSIASYLDKYKIPRGDANYFENGTSDQEVFQNAGYAAITLGETFKNDRIHGPVDDTLNGIDFDELDRMVSALKEFIIKDNGKMY